MSSKFVNKEKYEKDIKSILNKYPSFERRILIHLSPEGASVYNLDYKGTSPRKIKITLNKSAEDLLTNFDGSQTLERIIEKLTDSRENFEKSVPVVLEFIERISEFVPIKFYNQPQSRNIEIREDRSRWVPMHASLELTNKCNLKCIYCYNESSIERNDFLKKPVDVLKNLKKLGVEIIELTGGEPLLHPEILKILEFVGENFTISALLSNGCMVNDHILKLLKKYRERIIVQICLNGSTADKVERTTGIKGSFDKITKAIEILSEEGIIIRVGMVIDSLEKLNDIENTLILAKRLGAKFFQLSTALPLGRGRNLALQFKEEDILKLESLNKRLAKEYKDFFIYDFENLVKDSKNESINCGAGYKSIVISPNGKIRPCPLSPNEFGRLGEIKYSHCNDFIGFEHSLMGIFANLKAPDRETCGNCMYLPWCFKCVIRGLIKAMEIGENCNWLKNNEDVKIIKNVFTNVA